MSNQVEQIRAEVERRIKSWEAGVKYEGDAGDCQSRVTELTDLKIFIDSLPAKENPILVPESKETPIEVHGKKVVVRYAEVPWIRCSDCALFFGGKCTRPGGECARKAPLSEEIHSLREWAQILAPNPDLRAEFDKMCPPPPIQGSIAPEADLDAEIDKKVQELHTAPCYNELAAFARHFVAIGATMDAKKKRVTMSGFYSPVTPNRLVNVPDLANKGALFQDAGFVPGEPVEITIEAHNTKHK